LTLVSQAGLITVSLRLLDPNPPVVIERAPPFRTFFRKFLHDARTSKFGEGILPVDQVYHSSVSMLNIPPIRMDLVLESLHFAIGCHVHADRVLDTR